MRKYEEEHYRFDNIKEVITKKNDVMAFINCSDDTGSISVILFPKVYKQTSSTSYYDKQPYYLWKNYSDNLELSCVRDDGSVVFEITIPESSSSPLTIHQFVINIGKLIEIRYFVGETMMGDSYVNYQNVVIEVPEILTNRQSDAIES